MYYNPTDYFEIDALLTDENKMIRAAVREWVNRNVKPIVEDYAQQHKPLPTELMRQMGELGALGPFIPEKYGGPGLDHISYGLIMTELERGDSAVRSGASVQSSLVMYPIYTFGDEAQRVDRKSTRLNSSHTDISRMPSSA